MPPLTRWMIKTSLVYLVLALAAGLLIALRLPWVPAGLTPAYFHLFMVGWISLLIFGVVFWMFPKESKERPRGNEQLGWAVFITLNAGLILRIIGEPLLTARPDANAGWMLAVSALLQLFAGWGFIANTWTRVRER